MSLTVFDGAFVLQQGRLQIGNELSGSLFTQSFTTVATNSFVVPNGVSRVFGLVVGGGGGGGGSRGDRGQGNTGGAGGALAYGSFPVTSGEVLSIIVGAGGAAGANDANGGAGGRSFISGSGGNYLVAAGGAAGLTRSTAATIGGTSSGLYRENGGNGGNGGGSSDNNSGGGGGGAGGYTGDGGAGGNAGAGANGAGGGGGGAGATNAGAGYGGGGVGFPTSGSNGTGGALNAVGTGGSGGANGTVSNGGLYGGGGGARDDDSAGAGGAGAQGVGYLAYVLFNDINPQPTQSIVTRSLTHRFDAGDPTSYSGTGNVWTNLNGTGNLELVNSPVFVSNASASRFVFDGVNDYMTGSGYLTGSAPKSHTLNLIGSFSALPATFTRFRFFTDNANPSSYGVIQPGTGIGPGEVIISQGTTDFNATIYDPRGAVQFVAQNTLAMFTFVSSEAGVYFYLNGTQLGSDTTNPFVDNSFISPTRVYWWGSDANGNNPVSMSMAHIMWYSASLTPEEVARNYNVLRSRYGI
jgi:hypothetical protein